MSEKNYEMRDETQDDTIESLFETEQWIATLPTAYQHQTTARKSNAVVAASYKLSLNEQRVVYGILQQIATNEEVTDQRIYHVTTRDIEPETRPGGNEFHALRSACNSLFDRVVVIRKQPNGNGNLGQVLRTRWIQSEVTYLAGEGAIGLRLSHDILPYIAQLKADFARIPVQPVMSMTSAHASRIFEMLMQFRDTGIFTINVSELRERLGLEKAYPRFNDFKKRVIDIALKQINQHAGINVNVEYVKRGRTTVALIFRFQRDTMKELKTAQKEAEKERAKQEKAAEEEARNQRPSNSDDSTNDAKQDEMREAMLLLVQNGYTDVSVKRIKNIMHIYKKSPLESVQRQISKDKHLRS